MRWTKPYCGLEHDADMPRTHQITMQTFGTFCTVTLLHLAGLHPFTPQAEATGTREECVSIAEGWHNAIARPTKE